MNDPRGVERRRLFAVCSFGLLLLRWRLLKLRYVSETNTSHFTATNPKIELDHHKNHRDLGSAVIQHLQYIEEATTKVSWKPPANSPSTERP
eukprot:scaffold12981_cov80-Skeletonema_marinoi.AAC.2